MYFNTKIGIPEKSYGEYSPALAVGIYDVGTKNDRTDYNIVYAKMAKTFSINDFSLGRFSVGYFRGSSKLLLDKNSKKDNQGVFAAWEKILTEITDRLWVCAEYMGTESSYGSWNFGFSWKFAENVSAIFGYNLYNNRDLADTVTMQVDIDF